MRMVAHPEP